MLHPEINLESALSGSAGEGLRLSGAAVSAAIAPENDLQWPAETALSATSTAICTKLALSSGARPPATCDGNSPTDRTNELSFGRTSSEVPRPLERHKPPHSPWCRPTHTYPRDYPSASSARGQTPLLPTAHTSAAVCPAPGGGSTRLRASLLVGQPDTAGRRAPVSSVWRPDRGPARSFPRPIRATGAVCHSDDVTPARSVLSVPRLARPARVAPRLLPTLPRHLSRLRTPRLSHRGRGFSRSSLLSGAPPRHQAAQGGTP